LRLLSELEGGSGEILGENKVRGKNENTETDIDFSH
jgi:hypothetical protein